MARPKDLGLEHTWRTRSRAEGDSRSAANKAWQHESRSGRLRARGDPTGRAGVVGPERDRRREGQHQQEEPGTAA